MPQINISGDENALALSSTPLLIDGGNLISPRDRAVWRTRIHALQIKARMRSHAVMTRDDFRPFPPGVYDKNIHRCSPASFHFTRLHVFETVKLWALSAGLAIQTKRPRCNFSGMLLMFHERGWISSWRGAGNSSPRLVEIRPEDLVVTSALIRVYTDIRSSSHYVLFDLKNTNPV